MKKPMLGRHLLNNFFFGGLSFNLQAGPEG